MILFANDMLREAYLCAESGGQALHRDKPSNGKAESIAGHLIDHDLNRLFFTALGLGIHKPKIERAGLAGQRVLLSGMSYWRAVAMCKIEELPLWLDNQCPTQ